MDKKRRKELREEYEKKKGEQFVKELEKQPSVSWFEYVELLSEQVGYLDIQVSILFELFQ